jgi:hypothetical protein
MKRGVKKVQQNEGLEATWAHKIWISTIVVM